MKSSKKPPLSVRIPKVLKRYKDEALRGVYGRSGRWARLARFPIPMLEPWRAPEIHLRRPQGLGDVLLCTPAIRELKRRNPQCRVYFYTDYPAFVRGLPYIDEVRPTSLAPSNSLFMDYKDAIPVHAHIARVIGDRLGLGVSDVTPDCMVDSKLVQKWKEAWSSLPRPHILILRRASSWTPNKDWQEASWVELINEIAHFGTVIESGATVEQTPVPHGSYVDLRGSTSLEELIAAVAAADLYIGPISGAMHIAAAVKTPAIVIAGGV